MQLTGKQIIENGIIINARDRNAQTQQQGVDVRISQLFQLDGIGVIPLDGKMTVLPRKKEITPHCSQIDGRWVDDWIIEPGYYEVVLEEGCKIPDNVTLHFKTRSSLVRCGAIIHSGQFDAGFETEKMGCFLQVLRKIIIYKGSRIAQAICFTSDDVDNLYDGQFQNDRQR